MQTPQIKFNSDAEYSHSINSTHLQKKWNSFIKMCLLIKTHPSKTLFRMTGLTISHIVLEMFAMVFLASKNYHVEVNVVHFSLSPFISAGTFLCVCSVLLS
jgi:hypothetical protein